MRRLQATSVIAVLMLTAGGVLPATPVSAADPPGPVAEWTFDEPSGATVEDGIGNLDGAMSGGVARITDSVPQGSGALAFDGVDGLVSIANNPVLEPQAFTLTAWVKGLGEGWQSIISKGNADCSGSSWGLEINGSLNGTWLSAGSGEVVRQMGTRAGGPVWDDAWHHVVYTYGGPSNPWSYVYVDGHRTGGYNGAIPSGVRYAGSPLTVTDLVLGGPASACEFNHSFAGALDDVRLYNRVISESEVYAFLEPFETSLSVWVEPATLRPSQDILYRAQVTPVPPSGSVRFYLTKEGEAEHGYVSAAVNEWGEAGWLNYHGQLMTTGNWSVRGVFSGGGPAGDSASTPFAFSIEPYATTVELSVGFPGALANQPIPLQSTTAWAGDAALTGPPPGSVTFFEVTSEGDVELGTANLVQSMYVTPSTPTATLNAPGKPIGTYTYRARYNGSDAYAPATDELVVEVGKTPTYSEIEATPNPVQHHHETTIQATTWGIGPSSAPLAATGSTIIRDLATGAIVASGPVGTQLAFTTSSLPVGTHSFRAEYAGDSGYQASQSEPLVVSVYADTVDATGVGLSYSTFYPYKDGYRDTVIAQGTRSEVASVTIKVYSPAGKRLKTATVGAGTGAYRWSWNGRNSSGTMYPAGKYKVVQVLNDGHVKNTWTDPVSLSAKRLSTSTQSFTKTLAQRSAGSPSRGWVGWSFRLPSAAVYKKLGFSVYGRSGAPLGWFGPHSFTNCGATWNYDCMSPVGRFPASMSWKRVTGNVTSNRHGRTVQMYAVGGGETYLKYARVTVTYAVLK